MDDSVRLAFSRIPLLASLDPVFRDQLLPFCTVRSIHRNETIFRQEEASRHCFGLVCGHVSILRLAADPKLPPKLLGVLNPGDIFGENALYENTPRAASAVAKTDAQLLVIEGNRFREWIQAHPEGGLPLVMALFQDALTRMRHTSQQLALVTSASRLLSGNGALEEKVGEWIRLVRQALEGVEDVRVFYRNELWDEYQELAHETSPHSDTDHGFDVSFLNRLRESSDALETEQEGKAVLIAPLLNPEAKDPLAGYVALFSRAGQQPFSGPVRLVLLALADPLAGALARENRSLETKARAQLEHSRARFTF